VVPASPALKVSNNVVTQETPVTKRLLDIALSGAGLILSAPLWALVAIAIKLEDGGPVFYGQERVGQGGRRFDALKFRSMVTDAEAGRAIQATSNDPRVTRVGRLMRATALDELPQLWNILRGDMSFVGPRAVRPQEVETNGSGEAVSIDDIPGARERHQVRPGLTGIAQIFAPRDITRRNKFRYDRVYIRRQGFWFDVRLILLSFWITARGKWEHTGQKF
jgi:lipopolysaccharide/colanic/teichoic acid biosynthesis glycosyltransferase